MSQRKEITINRRTLKRREKELQGNQWASKLLFFELPQEAPTLGSEIYVLRKEVRGDGVSFLPTRTTIENILNAGLDCWDEGNAFSTYAADDIYDEGDAGTTLVEVAYDEGDAFTLTFTCCPCETDGDVAVSQIWVQPINNLSADATLNQPFYYRVGAGSTFTVAEAAPLFNLNRPLSFRIKNTSGSNITVQRSGSDQIYTQSGLVTSFVLADGESANMVASASDRWDLI